jgi:hypothetical protein
MRSSVSMHSMPQQQQQQQQVPGYGSDPMRSSMQHMGNYQQQQQQQPMQMQPMQQQSMQMQQPMQQMPMQMQMQQPMQQQPGPYSADPMRASMSLGSPRACPDMHGQPDLAAAMQGCSMRSSLAVNQGGWQQQQQGPVSPRAGDAWPQQQYQYQNQQFQQQPQQFQQQQQFQPDNMTDPFGTGQEEYHGSSAADKMMGKECQSPMALGDPAERVAKIAAAWPNGYLQPKKAYQMHQQM